MANADTITLPGGEVRFEGLNEVSIVSTVEDPPKLRQAAPWPSLGLGCLTGNRLRPDGGQEEMVLIQFKQGERTRSDRNNLSGEITIHIRNGAVEDADKGMVLVAVLRHDGCWFLNPSFSAPPDGGGGAPPPPPDPSPEPPPPDYVALHGEYVKSEYEKAFGRQPDLDELYSDSENVHKYGEGWLVDSLWRRGGYR